jgi:hypothetical protein
LEEVFSFKRENFFSKADMYQKKVWRMKRELASKYE